jgi:DNA polymerase-3 subunit alpha
MAFVTLEDLDGSMEVTVFAKVYKAAAELLVADAAVVVAGRANLHEGSVKILADEVFPIAEARERLVRAVHLRLRTPGLSRATLEEAGRLARRHRGKVPLFVHVVIPGHSETVLLAGGSWLVRPSPELVAGLEGLLGKEAVNLR